MNIKKPRGTRDFTPREMCARDQAEKRISQVFESYNYRRILTPTFEHAELFSLKSGEEIEEHMYVFEDKGGRRLCLRPEATASVCRMYSEEMRDSRLPLRMYYSCPMFRYERPQKGRYREFWQLGVELIGPKGPEADAEVISAAYFSLKELGLAFVLEVGHIGVLRGLMEDLSIQGEAQDRIIAAVDKGEEEELKKLVGEPAILKLLELKGAADVLGKAEKLLAGHSKAASALAELKEVLSWLDASDVKYTLNLGIARGLEYYTGAVFEARVPELGAQSQICGGGRYDDLIKLFSGLSVPAVGFAFGFDRVMNALEAQGITLPEAAADVVVAAVNDSVRKDASKIADMLRLEFSVDFDVMGRKLDKALKYAGETGARYAVIVGPTDLQEECVTLRDMAYGSQETVAISELAEKIRQH